MSPKIVFGNVFAHETESFVKKPNSNGTLNPIANNCSICCLGNLNIISMMAKNIMYSSYESLPPVLMVSDVPSSFLSFGFSLSSFFCSSDFCALLLSFFSETSSVSSGSSGNVRSTTTNINNCISNNTITDLLILERLNIFL